MADRFASIAAGEIGSREPLVQPKPIADNGKRFGGFDYIKKERVRKTILRITFERCYASKNE